MPSDSLHSSLGMDSLAKAELLLRIEKAFHVRLSDDVIEKAKTFKDLIEAVITENLTEKESVKQNIYPREFSNADDIDISQTTTLNDLLFLCASKNRDQQHIYFQDEGGNENITYAELLEKSQRIASALIKQGLLPGETIAIMLPTHPHFFYVFFGILIAGCIPVPIYPPQRAYQIESYIKQAANILNNCKTRILIVFNQAKNISHLLSTFIPRLKKIITADLLLQEQDKAPWFPSKENDLALIQYTSGSTSSPKGVALTHQNLLANIRAFGNALQITSKDVVVSWLPLYHDLGLIGMWLGSLYYRVPLIIFSPLTFLNRPEKWLWAMHYYRGTISAGPNFAYALCTRKIEKAAIEGLDLSSWRLAINGAEMVSHKTLEEFHQKFSAYGFRFEAFTPVYGLAESCLGLTASHHLEAPQFDYIERKAFDEKQQAITTNFSDKKNCHIFVSCGKTFPKHSIRIVDQNDQILPERRVGYLQFKGVSSMQGYYNNAEATKAVFHDGWIHTGDMAYQAEGDLYITGRQKDIIIKAGRNFYPSEIENLIGQMTEIKEGAVIAFGVTNPQYGTEEFIIVAGTRNNKIKNAKEVINKIKQTIFSILDIMPDKIILVPAQVIPKTSSGKLQRNACKMAYLNGTLTKQNQLGYNFLN